MAKSKKAPVKTKSSANPTIKIDWEAIVADTEFTEAMSLLGAILVRKTRNPCVHANVINIISAVTTLLVVMDGDLKWALQALEQSQGSAVGKFVKPSKRKKAVSRR
jgi:hypothetical protein